MIRPAARVSQITHSALRAMLGFLPALGVTVLAVGAGLAQAAPRPDDGTVGVVFAPWVSPQSIEAAVSAAGGRIAQETMLGNVVLAVSADPSFQQHLREQGALFLLSARAICG